MTLIVITTEHTDDDRKNITSSREHIRIYFISYYRTNFLLNVLRKREEFLKNELM